VLLLLAQEKNWEEKCSFAGKRYRKGDLILLKNTDFEKSSLLPTSKAFSPKNNF
jgi:hypothetical protein